MPEMNAQSALERSLEGELDDSQTPDAFCVRDDESANWVVKKIIENREYAKRCAIWCNREQARAMREEEFFLFRFGQQLLDYTRQKIASAGGRRKSVSLPAGTVGFRSEPLKLVVDDEGSVIAWAKQHRPELISTIERPSKSGLNEHFEQTGEVPDAGVRIEPAREKFFVK
jgi:phage host-nuclease inhibitor protein Gam